ncbi:MAG: DUF4440 domain-containing protein [Cyclobacteriaceae bacterium]
MKKLVVLLLLVAFGCQQGGGPISQADKDAVQALIDDFAAKTNANENPSAIYAADAVTMPPHAAAVSGAEAIGSFHADTGQAQTTSFQLNAIEIEGSGHVAFARGTWTYEGTVNDTIKVSDNGKFMVVYKKQADNTWKAYREIWNSDQPMPGGN